jgi:FG-GAP-like repeat
MKWLTALVAIGVGSAIIGPAAKAQPRPVITITDVAGRLRGSFAPLDLPIANPETGPLQFATAAGSQPARTADGLIVAGVGFVGWREVSTNRVVVLLLLAKDRTPATARIDLTRDLQRRQLASFTVAPGESRHLIELKDLGLESLIVRGDVRDLSMRGSPPPSSPSPGQQPERPTPQKRSRDIRFAMRLIDPGYCESVAVADFNNDGKLDILSGEYWFEAPSWAAHKIRDIPFTSGYVDNFSDLPVDVDGDGYTDVVQIAYFARRIVWLKNPGKSKNPWVETEIEAIGPTEFAFLVDLNNDGKALEILPQFTGAAASPVLWYELQDHKWVRHVVSPQSYGHGIGVGDLNGDGRNDILTAKGWLESPADPRAAVDWTFHPSDWGQAAASEFGFMYVLDVNGDGRMDVVTTIAHANGVLWIEQGADGKWTSRTIDNTWSQAHTSALADLTGDGQVELITGKRYHARNAAADASEREPLGLYWYEFQRTPSGVAWLRHIIDYGGRAGTGLQMVAIDIDRDGDVDVVTGGKTGVFLAENLSVH